MSSYVPRAPRATRNDHSRPHAVTATAHRSQSPIRVVIVDDDRLLLELMQARLVCVADVEVVGTAEDGAAALAVMQQCRPDVLILDLCLPGMDGVEVARRVLASFPQVAILVVTAFGHFWDYRALLRIGVHGYLSKTASTNDLLLALNSVAQGQRIMPGVHPLPHKERETISLTIRELDVLKLLAAGQRNAEIADTLCIAIKTVEDHIRHLFAKLEARSRTEVVLKAQQQGLPLHMPRSMPNTP